MIIFKLQKLHTTLQVASKSRHLCYFRQMPIPIMHMHM